MENQQFYNKLNNIEEELIKLRLQLASNVHKEHKKVVSLKGILKGVRVEEEDIKKAKKSLFKNLSTL